MKIENGKIVLGMKNCWCGDGKMPAPLTCTKCKGTGKGPRGAKHGCRTCGGSGKQYGDRTATCTRCNGNHINFEPEKITDTLPKEIWQSLTFKVYRHNLGITGNESLLGLGCVFSCQDYGRAFKETDDQKIIDDVRTDNPHHQACKVAKDDGTLCDHVGIFINTGGYSVRPVFNNPSEVLATIANERPENEYLAVGRKITAEGGNGTIGALYRNG